MDNHIKISSFQPTLEVVILCAVAQNEPDKTNAKTNMSATRLAVDHNQAIKHAEVSEILRALANLRYGSVEIVVHDGRITQIERREKVRVSNPLTIDRSSEA